MSYSAAYCAVQYTGESACQTGNTGGRAIPEGTRAVDGIHADRNGITLQVEETHQRQGVTRQGFLTGIVDLIKRKEHSPSAKRRSHRAALHCGIWPRSLLLGLGRDRHARDILSSSVLTERCHAIVCFGIVTQ